MADFCGYTQEEITKMLFTIVDICYNNDCNDCPFMSGDCYCQFREESPLDWKFNGKKIWEKLQNKKED